jgi:hypothetical protein
LYIQADLQYHIYKRFDQSILRAVECAVETASGWGAHKSMGGMAWTTYKATCRRGGAYTGAAGPRDFNAELLEPIPRHLATGWERVFQNRVPVILKEFAKVSRKLLDAFHRVVVNRAKGWDANGTGIVILAKQIAAHCRTLNDVPTNINATITELQRDANRDFAPVVGKAMNDAYQTCVLERGKSPYLI